MKEEAISHLIPPVQNIAIFLFLTLDNSLSTKLGNSVRLSILGIIELLKVPISVS